MILQITPNFLFSWNLFFKSFAIGRFVVWTASNVVNENENKWMAGKWEQNYGILVSILWPVLVYILWPVLVSILWPVLVYIYIYIYIYSGLYWYLYCGLYWYLYCGLYWYLYCGLYWYLCCGLYWYLYCGLYSLGLQSKDKLCMCAYSPDFCSNFVVPYKCLNVKLCRRLNVKGHGSECCFVAIYHLPSLLLFKINDPCVCMWALWVDNCPLNTLRWP